MQFLVVSILRVEGLPGFGKIIGPTGLYAYAALDFAGCKPMKTTKVHSETLNIRTLGHVGWLGN